MSKVSKEKIKNSTEPFESSEEYPQVEPSLTKPFFRFCIAKKGSVEKFETLRLQYKTIRVSYQRLMVLYWTLNVSYFHIFSSAKILNIYIGWVTSKLSINKNCIQFASTLRKNDINNNFEKKSSESFFARYLLILRSLFFQTSTNRAWNYVFGVWNIRVNSNFPSFDYCTTRTNR